MRAPDFSPQGFKLEPIVGLDSSMEIVGYELLLHRPNAAEAMSPAQWRDWHHALPELADYLRGRAPVGQRQRLFVNVDSWALADDGIYESLQRIRARHIVWEWTEYTGGEFSLREVTRRLEWLRRRDSAEVAFDDCGAGMGFFTRLSRLEPDFFKVDGELFERALDDPTAYRSIQLLLNTTATLSARGIIEWVATPEHLAAARTLGVELGQGFYWPGYLFERSGL